MSQLVTPGAQQGINLLSQNQTTKADLALKAESLRLQREDMDAQIKLAKEQLAYQKSKDTLDRVTMTDEAQKERASREQLQALENQGREQVQATADEAAARMEEKRQAFEKEMFAKQQELQSISLEADAAAAQGTAEETKRLRDLRQAKQDELIKLQADQTATELAMKKLADPNMQLAELEDMMTDLATARGQSSTATKTAVQTAASSVFTELFQDPQKKGLWTRLNEGGASIVSDLTGGIIEKERLTQPLKEGLGFGAIRGEGPEKIAAKLAGMTLSRLEEQGLFGKDPTKAAPARAAVQDLVQKVIALRAVEKTGDTHSVQAQREQVKVSLQNLKQRADPSTISDILQQFGDSFDAAKEGSDVAKIGAVDSSGNWTLKGMNEAQMNEVRTGLRWLATVDDAAKAGGFADPAAGLEQARQSFSRAAKAVDIVNGRVNSREVTTALEEATRHMTPKERAAFEDRVDRMIQWSQESEYMRNSVDGMQAQANLLLEAIKTDQGTDALSVLIDAKQREAEAARKRARASREMR